jgi:hypothetical protein
MSVFFINHSYGLFQIAKCIVYYSMFLLFSSLLSPVMSAETKIKNFKFAIFVMIAFLASALAFDYPYKKLENKILTLKSSLLNDNPKDTNLINRATISELDPIRVELAKNRNTPPSTLKMLMSDTDKEVRSYSLANLQRQKLIPLDVLDYQYSEFVAFFQAHLAIISILLTVLLVLFGGRIRFLAQNRKLFVAIIVGNMTLSSTLEEIFYSHDELRNYVLEYSIQNKVVNEKEIGQWILVMNDSGIQFLVGTRRYLPTESLKFLLVKEDVNAGLKMLVKKELIARKEYPPLEDEGLKLPFEKDQDFNDL